MAVHPKVGRKREKTQNYWKMLHFCLVLGRARGIEKIRKRGEKNNNYPIRTLSPVGLFRDDEYFVSVYDPKPHTTPRGPRFPNPSLAPSVPSAAIPRCFFLTTPTPLLPLVKFSYKNEKKEKKSHFRLNLRKNYGALGGGAVGEAEKN